MRYRVTITFDGCGDLMVDAKNQEEAVREAKKKYTDLTNLENLSFDIEWPNSADPDYNEVVVPDEE